MNDAATGPWPPTQPVEVANGSYVFHVPAGWLPPPDGWRPPKGWKPQTGWPPDPSWPAAPAGWVFWSLAATYSGTPPASNLPSDHGVKRIRDLAKGLAKGSHWLGMIAGIGAVIGVIAAISLAAHTSTDAAGASQHTNIGLGLAIAAAAIIGGLFNWVIARAIRLFANHIAFQHGVDAEPMKKAHRQR